METILMTGASGFIGQHLSLLLREKGYRVLMLSRNFHQSLKEDHFLWNPATGSLDPEALKQADHLIHLAGTGIGDRRWTTLRKQEIWESRINTCQGLLQKTIEVGAHLKTFVSASAVGFYGTKVSEKAFTEKDSAGEGFLASVCKAWEHAADEFEAIGIRTVKIRTGLVLGKNGGILPQMLLPVRIGLGAPIGSGKQILPWIHLNDLCNIYLKAIQDRSYKGAYNAVAPELINNHDFTKTLAKIMHRPFWPIPIPAFPVKWFIGERSKLILEGHSVLPERLEQAGFDFQYTNSKAALYQILT
jgi:uncharacterized protein